MADATLPLNVLRVWNSLRETASAWLRANSRRVVSLLLLLVAVTAAFHTLGYKSSAGLSKPSWGYCANVNTRVPALEGQEPKPAGLLHNVNTRWEHLTLSVRCCSHYWAHVVGLGVKRGTAHASGMLQQIVNGSKLCAGMARGTAMAFLATCAELLTATWPFVLTLSLLTSLAASAAAVYFYRRRRTVVEDYDAPELPDGFDSFEDFEIVMGMLTQLYESEEEMHAAVRERFEGLQERNANIAAAYHRISGENAQLRGNYNQLQAENSTLDAEKSTLAMEKSTLESRKSALEAEKTNLERETARLQMEIGRIQSAHERRIQDERRGFQAEENRLQARLQSVEERYSALKDELSNARAIIEVLQAESG